METSENNPAVAKHTAVPPALVEAVAKNAAAAQPVIRAMALVQLVELHQARHLYTPVQRLQLAEMNAKLGDMIPKQAAVQAPTGAVTINFIRSNDRSVTIEADGVTMEGEP